MALGIEQIFGSCDPEPLGERQDRIAVDIPCPRPHGQPAQGDAQAVARRLVHLTVDQGHLIENVRLLHLVVEVVALAGVL